jgi:Xaa-Pro aminopeptidase
MVNEQSFDKMDRIGIVFEFILRKECPEENIYIRLEDMIVATETGVEVITNFVPRDIAGIEALMKEEGLLQKFDFKPEQLHFFIGFYRYE